MAVVAGLAMTSSFVMVNFERNPSAPTTGKLCGANGTHPSAEKMGSRLTGVKAQFGSFKTGGAGVLERPSFDQSQFDPSTQVLEGGDIGRSTDRKRTGNGDSYRVLLVDDAQHSEKLVAKVLPRAVPSVTPEDARKLFHESRENGVAIVIVTVKEHAEFYSEMMVRGGLRSIIEPGSSEV
ncbi:ATP-dependent Clp protease adapter protein CLPS2, chloroplastic-like [Hibiscus syriacus]|uniref:ATP-dependent Clp protease adapter protein CLPS2, chloroplastic-like n=1 Tax=Hibiscus syriacus TaxID=106335 RepID=UPI001922D323|nr:ATP-dependent Clp protease adapter protein CLPS2, chloroplastic-like [Hibiscus syriacus]